MKVMAAIIAVFFSGVAQIWGIQTYDYLVE